MKTVVCGLGKCGSRMVLDLSALIYGGKYSCQLRVPKDTLLEKPWVKKIAALFKKKPELFAKNMHQDEVPPMHLGDSDDQNEVLNMCNKESDDEKDEERRQRLKDSMIVFDNYHDACGQYHIIGEEVMRNLFETHPALREQIINKYIKLNDANNVSAYFILFSAGGGTGCGTSTILAEEIAKRVKEQYHNMLIAGVTALPGARESENYKISAGRFITKFLSSNRTTSFDTVFTVSNSIMEGIDSDPTETQTEANMFVAHLIFSIINSSSKYNRSSVNPDGPELCKNIHGLAYFCFAQKGIENTAKGDMITLDLFRRALSPVSTISAFNSGSPDLASFEGTSISFTEGKIFTKEDWQEMLNKIEEFTKFVKGSGSGSSPVEPNNIKGNTNALKEKLDGLFSDPETQLPLATRSCRNVVILRGIPDGQKCSNWEQTCLTTLAQTIFPKARIHYYATYHQMKEHTLTLLPSDYISGEILRLISSYLTKVWEKDVKGAAVMELLIKTQEPLTADEITEIFGEHETFERHFPEFPQIRANTSGRFKLKEDVWDQKYINAEQVAGMMNYVHSVVANTKKEPEESEEELIVDI